MIPTMSLEIRPKSLGTLEKRAPGTTFPSGPDHFAPGNLAADHFATNYSASALG